MGKVKGTSSGANREFVLQKATREQFQTVLDSLPEHEARLFSRPILPAAWVDHHAHLRFILAADRILGRGDGELVKAAAVYCARKDLKGMYRLFMSFTSPHFIIKNAGRVWRQYYDQGNLVLEEVQEKSGRMRLDDYPDIPLQHDLENTAWVEECLRMSGCREPVGRHLQCRARGDRTCTWEFSWR